VNPDDLIERLSAEAGRRPRRSIPSSLITAVSAATIVTLGLSYALMAPVEWTSRQLMQPVFLLKIAFLVSLLLASLSIVRDLSSPGRKVSLQLTFALVPFLILAALSYDEVTARHPAGLQHELVHQSIVACLLHVGLLAVPAFAILVFTVKAFAPVDLSRAGLYIGVLSGCIGALGYAFHCHDELITLVAVSYTLAIVQMGLIGALLGPRLLRWA
jgi:hypothetical protein